MASSRTQFDLSAGDLNLGLGMANLTRARLQRIRDFLDEADIARQDQSKLSKWRRVAHFWYMVGRSFQSNRAPVRASALAYTTLLALIPILAMFVSISTSFLKKDGEKPIDNLIRQAITTLAPQLGLAQSDDPEQAAQNRSVVVQNILSYIDNINSGKLGATAAVALIFVGISLLSTIEATFNDMWGATRGRPWSARVVQYWAALSLGPLFIVTALALTTSTQFGKVNRMIEAAPILGVIVFKLLPVFVLVTALTLFYKLMPNTRVLWVPALIGGLVGGLLLHANSLFSVIYLSKVVSYSKIYGSLGAVPIFLIGMYFSWLIVLFGSQVGYAYQNRLAYLQEREAESVNQQGREFVALRIMTFVAQRFDAGDKPPTRIEMAKHLGIPTQLAIQVIQPLLCSKLLVEVQGEETSFAPGRPIEKISLEDILCSLRAGQGRELATCDDAARAVVREQYERVLISEMQVANAVTLKTIISRIAALPPAAAEKEGCEDSSEDEATRA
jgi:membrane protein